MKKIRCLLLIAACLMGCLILSSCSAVFTPPAQEAEPVYEIFYTSGGDGTCYVHKITVNAEQNEPFVLEVPPKSPEGDTVTAIKCEPFANLIPQILTEEEYNRLIALMKEKYKAGEITFQERNTISYVYGKCSIEKALCGKNNPETLDDPFVYVYKNHVTEGCVITDVPDAEISNAFLIAGYTPQTIIDGYEAIREQVNAMECPDRDAMLEALSAFTLPDNLGIYVSEIKLPDTVQEISAGFYSSCRLIKNVDLPGSITRVTARMFMEMTSLESVSIPEGVTHIDFFAFLGCSSLKHLEIPNSIEEIDSSAFSANMPVKGNFYQGGYYLGNPENPYVVLYKVSESVKTFTTHPNTKLIYDDAFDGAKSLSTITLTEGIGKTGVYMFSFCDFLSSATLPDSLTEITHGTFSRCELLKNVNIPPNVTYIGRDTFQSCAELTEIELPQGLDIIHESLFQNCKKLKSVNIPKNVTEIHIAAFQRCESLKSIILPKSVQIIGKDVFDQSGLKDLYYEGNAEDFAKIQLFENAIPDNVIIYFYSETQPTEAGSYWRYVDGVPVAW